MKTMKKNWMAVALTMAVAALTFAACSSDDDEIGGHGDAKEIAAVAGEDFPWWRTPKTETSDPLTLFFREELHGPYWDSDGIEHKTFFERGNYDDNPIIIINSREEFQSAYMGTKSLPEVDFSRYTLVLGRTWGNDGSYSFSQTILWNKVNYYYLELRLEHMIGVMATMAIEHFYYWRLYPKLKNNNVIPHRSVVDIYK